MSEWLKMDFDTLLTHLETPPGMSGGRHETAKAFLDVRLMQAQGKTAKTLVRATWVLAVATLALVLATGVLVFVTWRMG